MNRIIVFCSLLTVSFSAMSAPYWWMKKDDYNILGLYVNAGSDCLFDEEDLMNLAEGEYLRARIKPAGVTNNLMMTVDTLCMKIKNSDGSHGADAVNYNIFFTRRTYTPDEAWIRYGDITYRALYVVSEKHYPKKLMLNTIRDAVSEALTDYLKANME